MFFFPLQLYSFEIYNFVLFEISIFCKRKKMFTRADFLCDQCYYDYIKTSEKLRFPYSIEVSIFVSNCILAIRFRKLSA